MKKILIFLLAIGLLEACNNNGGGWGKQDETKWMNSCMNQLGTNPRAREICSCILQKAEKTFATYQEEETKGTAEQGRQWAQECSNVDNRNGGGGILNNNNRNGNNNNGDENNINRNENNTGGGWSRQDENKWLNACINQLPGNPRAREICSCILKKAEQTFATYEEEENNGTAEQGRQWAQECSNATPPDNGDNENNNEDDKSMSAGFINQPGGTTRLQHCAYTPDHGKLHRLQGLIALQAN